MKFSERTAWELGDNDFADAVQQAHMAGRPLLDLTVSNPTRCGFDYDENTLLAPLSQPGALHYEPVPFGTAPARQAVATYYRDHDADIPIDSICLTTSTSEAYSYLFRLLCDPGDEVLVASPSYPLFDFIARLDSVRLVHYPLLYDPHAEEGWLIDLHALAASITARTRAILVVHPNNPTGQYCSATEHAALQTVCDQHGLALIVDEVFLDYPLSSDALGPQARSFACTAGPALTFVLSGISKVCGLPQMKCSWIAAIGPPETVRAAMGRLEVIADTFLSMNAPVQHALPRWLAGRRQIQQQILARMRQNLASLDTALHGSASDRLHTGAGWSAILRVPQTIHGVPFSRAALDAGVIVQPGEFFGLPPGRAVLSLLTPAHTWRAGLTVLRQLA